MSGEGRQKKPKNTATIVTAVVVAVFLILGGVTVKMLATKEVRMKKVVHEVTLVKAPPPPKKYEKPPEIEKKEEVKQEQVNVPQQQQDTPQEAPPPGNQLGVDAEGGAGGDNFGLLANKGGRSLIGSGTGGMDLLRKYQGYIHGLEGEINRELMKKGKLPKGGREALVRIVLDDRGNILSHQVYGSSGSPQVDEAINDVLTTMKRVSEPPPDGMPRVLRIKIVVPA